MQPEKQSAYPSLSRSGQRVYRVGPAVGTGAHQGEIHEAPASARPEFRYVEIRGTATTADDPGCALRDRIRAKHGIGADAPDPAAADRVVIAVEPVRIVTYGH